MVIFAIVAIVVGALVVGLAVGAIILVALTPEEKE